MRYLVVIFLLLLSDSHLLFVVPQDYDDLLSYYTKRGYRVIAIAGKSVEGLSWLKAQKLKRYVAFYRTFPTQPNLTITENKPNQTSVSWASSSSKTSSKQALVQLSNHSAQRI